MSAEIESVIDSLMDLNTHVCRAARVAAQLEGVRGMQFAEFIEYQKQVSALLIERVRRIEVVNELVSDPHVCDCAEHWTVEHSLTCKWG